MTVKRGLWRKWNEWVMKPSVLNSRMPYVGLLVGRR